MTDWLYYGWNNYQWAYAAAVLKRRGAWDPEDPIEMQTLYQEAYGDAPTNSNIVIPAANFRQPVVCDWAALADLKKTEDFMRAVRQ